ncbi:unnamed protein product, partial [Oppiella nova]
VMSPLGILLVIVAEDSLLDEDSESNPVIIGTTAIATGTLLYIIIYEILPNDKLSGFKRFLSVLCGFSMTQIIAGPTLTTLQLLYNTSLEGISDANDMMYVGMTMGTLRPAVLIPVWIIELWGRECGPYLQAMQISTGVAGILGTIIEEIIAEDIQTCSKDDKLCQPTGKGRTCRT